MDDSVPRGCTPSLPAGRTAGQSHRNRPKRAARPVFNAMSPDRTRVVRASRLRSVRGCFAMARSRKLALRSAWPPVRWPPADVRDEPRFDARIGSGLLSRCCHVRHEVIEHRCDHAASRRVRYAERKCRPLHPDRVGFGSLAERIARRANAYSRAHVHVPGGSDADADRISRADIHGQPNARADTAAPDDDRRLFLPR